MKNMIDLLACRCTCWGGKLYCMERDINLIFSIDLQDGTLELTDIIPQQDIRQNVICGHMTAYNGKLILTPHRTRKVWIYDLSSKDWDSIEIIEKENSYGLSGIYQSYIYNNNIFLIGGGYPAIIRLDIENKSCDYIESPYKDMISRHTDIDFFYFRLHGVQLENNLFLASCLDNYILKFDMETEKYQWIKIGSDNCAYSEITWDGSNFWLAPRLNCDIVKWDGKEKTEILPMPPELKPTTDTYAWGAYYDGEHVIFPCVSHPKSIVIDIQNDTFEIQDQQYTVYTRLDDGMVVNQTINGDLTVKTKDLVSKTYHPAISRDELKRFYEENGIPVFTASNLYYETSENPLLTLEDFLTFTAPTPQKQIPDEQIGKAIWKKIK